MTMNIAPIKGAGELNFALSDSAGAVDLDEIYSFGNMVTIEIDPQSETVEVNSTSDDTYGELIATDTETSGIKIKVSSNTFSPQTLAFALQGSLKTLAAAEQTVTDEPFVAHLAAKAKVPGRNVTGMEITDSTGTTTYVAGTDYVFDAELGYITYPAGTTITDEEDLLRSYVIPVETGQEIWPNAAPSQYLWLHWKGKNRLDGGRRWEVLIPLGTIKPDGTINLMSKEPVEGSFTVSALLKSGEDTSVKVYLAA